MTEPSRISHLRAPLAAALIASFLSSGGLPAAGDDPAGARFEEALEAARRHVRAEEYAEAFDLLGEFEDPASPILARVLEERKKVVAEARKHLGKVEAEAMRLLAKGDRHEAIEAVRSAEGKYPFAVEVEREKLLARVSEAEPGEKDGEAESTAAPGRAEADIRERALRLLAGLDFPAAREAIAAARSAADSGSGSLDALAREAELCGRAWDGIRSALEKAERRSGRIEIPASQPPVGEPPAGAPANPKGAWKPIVRGLRGSLVLVSRALRDPPGAYAILGLPDSLLLDLLRSEMKESPEEEAREALGLLLLHGRGPARAAPLLGSPAGGEKAGRHGDRLRDEAGPWLERKVEVLEERRKALASGAAKDPLAPALLAEEYRSAILAARASSFPGDGADLRVRLRDGFLETRGASAPVASLFPGRKTEAGEGGMARISWEFAEPGDALDFHPVGTASKAPRVEKGTLRIQGEYRILEDDPFIDRIAVRGTASDLPRGAPNVNVALWTSGLDGLTFREGSKVSLVDRMQADEKPIGDFILFGMGYRTVVATTMGKAMEKLSVANSKDVVKFPAFVVLGGTRSRTLHRNFSECLWGMTLDPPFPRRIEFSIDWRPEKVVWTVNRKPIPLMGVFAHLPPAAERRGSATILTNDEPLSLEDLEIEGRLDPGWLAERRKARAVEELRGLAQEMPELGAGTAKAEADDRPDREPGFP